MKKTSNGRNTNSPTNAELRENLWESYFKSSDRSVPPDELARHIGAIEMLHMMRDINNDATTQENRLRGVQMALDVWSLLAAEMGAWIIEELGKSGWPLPDPDDLAKDQRTKLYGMLLAQETGRRLPLHQEAFDPVNIFLPRWQALKLIEALEALDQGEVRPVFEPTATGRHDDPYSWDVMRYRALEHIAFLVGQDVGKVKARERVGKAMCVPVNTLKDWEKPANLPPLVRHQIELAKKAGKLSVVLVDNPDHAKIGSGNAMDGYEAAKLEDLTKEDLSAFGAKYSERHGHRHNPG